MLTSDALGCGSIFNCIPGLYPLDASSIPSPPVVTKIVFRFWYYVLKLSVVELGEPLISFIHGETRKLYGIPVAPETEILGLGKQHFQGREFEREVLSGLSDSCC